VLFNYTNQRRGQEELAGLCLGRCIAMNMKDEAGLGLPILSVWLALILAYENNCPLKLVRTGKHFLKWTYELNCLRREVRRVFNKC